MTSQREMEELFNTLAQHNIYRYKADTRIYKYMCVDTAKKALNNGSMKFSTADELKDNDLEMALLIFNLSSEMQAKELDKVCAALLQNGHNKNWVEARRKQINCVEMLTHSYKSLQKKLGFFCATTSNNNSRMWNDYADKNKGVCIEYTIPFFNPHYYSFKVNYDKKYNPMDLYDKDGNVNEVSVQRWYFTKRIQYEFENEIRVFYPYDSGIFHVDKRAFTGLFYGHETSPNDIVELEELLINSGYSFNKGVKAIY
jgi:hypothetical protein